jgi:hypothetical protein
MLTKHTIRDTVYAMLRTDAEELLARQSADFYHGWDDVTGRWLGQEELERALHQETLAELFYNTTSSEYDADCQDKRSALEVATYRLEQARERVWEVQAYNQRLVEARREQVLHRRVAKMFLRAYRRARSLEWDVYHPSVPESLRSYVQRQLGRGTLSPTSMVFLWLTLADTVKHGEDFQTEAITGCNHLLENPFVRASLNIDAPEDKPTEERRQYVRELQAQMVRDRRERAHESYDPRDALSDFQYDGLPDQLGAMWIDKDDACPRCQQGLRIRVLHSGVGYRFVKACPNYADDAECNYEALSPVVATRKALHEWAAAEWAEATV